tara:strand:- start:165 stop:386 length:222 start_codon:yes stop_codon:yes gene_type:complete
MTYKGPFELSIMYDHHPDAESTTVFQRARILHTAKHMFTADWHTYEQVRSFFDTEITQAAFWNQLEGVQDGSR